MFAALLAAAFLHTPHFVHEYTLPLGAYPSSIVSGPDGAMWFTTYPYFTNHPPIDLGVGRITMTGSLKFYLINHGTYDITRGPDSRLWFTSPYKYPDVVGAITTGGSIQLWHVPSAGSPESIIVGPDKNLWYTAFGGKPDIIRMAPNGHVIATYRSSGANAVQLGSGTDGFVWYDFPAAVGRISMSGKIVEHHVGGPTYIPDYMALGPDRRMWWCDGTYLVATTNDFHVHFYPIPRTVNGTYGLTVGPDGNLWATDFDQGQIIRITPAGKMSAYPIPTPNMVPSGITVGPDGNLWFTEIQLQTDVSKIGVLAP
jgi:virginiamycin B lyase